MKRYNPYKSAFSAAISELTSDRALNYYEIRAWQDAQAIVDAAVAAGTVAYQAAMMAYQMGAFCRAWLLATEQAAIEITAIVPGQSTAVIASEIEIIDAEIIDAEIIEESNYILMGSAPTPALMSAIVATRTRSTEQFVLSAIAPSVAALSLLLEQDSKPTRKTRKSKTEATAKPAPRARKAASPAPQKSATLARFEGYAAHID